jgi:hypothetical protein
MGIYYFTAPELHARMIHRKKEAAARSKDAAGESVGDGGETTISSPSSPIIEAAGDR